MSANQLVLRAVPYILVVETDSYTGNFERELCAFVTGSLAECNVGHEYAEVGIKALNEQHGDWADIVNEASMHVPDDSGFPRPVSIYNAGDNFGYEDVAIFFESIKYFPAGLLQFLKKRVYEFPAYHMLHNKRYGVGKPITIKDVYLLRNKVSYEQIRKEI